MNTSWLLLFGTPPSAHPPTSLSLLQLTRKENIEPTFSNTWKSLYSFHPIKQLHISFFCTLRNCFFKNFLKLYLLKWVFAKNERGYRLNAIKKALLFATSLTSICASRIKLLKTTNTEERSVHTHSERCNIQLGS